MALLLVVYECLCFQCFFLFFFMNHDLTVLIPSAPSIIIPQYCNVFAKPNMIIHSVLLISMFIGRSICANDIM